MQAQQGDSENYVIEDVFRWMDSFVTFEMFVYDEAISRYRRSNLEEIKSLMQKQVQGLVDDIVDTPLEKIIPIEQQPMTNGNTEKSVDDWI